MSSRSASLLVVSVLVSVTAFARAPGPNATPPVVIETAEFPLALVSPTNSLSEDAVKKAFKSFSKKGRSLQVRTVERAEVPGLSLEGLEYTAVMLGSADRAALERAKEAVTLTLSWPRKDTGALREAYESIAAIAAKHEALIYDQHAASAYTVADWKSRRLERGWTGTTPVAPLHFQVHMVPQDNGLIMFDTGGLRRFGLSDLVLLDVNRASLDSAGNLMNVVAQRLIEGARPDARGRLTIRLEDIKEPRMREGNIETRYKNAGERLVVAFVRADVSLGARENAVELKFPELDCADRGECLEAALHQLFGWTDSVTMVEHDEAVNEAKARAVAALQKYEKQVRNGLPPGTTLLVKAGFPYDKGTEWMWVDVQSWSGKTVKGRLANDPQLVKTLKAGATVDVRLDDVMDYIYELDDGTFYGNEVGKVLAPEMFEDAGGGRSRLRN